MNPEELQVLEAVKKLMRDNGEALGKGSIPRGFNAGDSKFMPYMPSWTRVAEELGKSPAAVRKTLERIRDRYGSVLMDELGYKPSK